MRIAFFSRITRAGLTSYYLTWIYDRMTCNKRVFLKSHSVEDKMACLVELIKRR